jgi:hypothetical protein
MDLLKTIKVFRKVRPVLGGLRDELRSRLDTLREIRSLLGEAREAIERRDDDEILLVLSALALQLASLPAVKEPGKLLALVAQAEIMLREIDE